jgi:hypothetical protein
VTCFAAFDYAQGALRDEAAQGAARGRATETSSTGDPRDGKPETEPPFQSAVPQKMRIDRAVDDGEAQPRHEKILELFPDVFGVGLFVFHSSDPKEDFGKRSRLSRWDRDLRSTVGSSRQKKGEAERVGARYIVPYLETR